MISPHNVFIIFKKEFLQLMRNKSIIVTNFIAPLIGLPLYLLFVTESAMHIAGRDLKPLEDKTIFPIALVGETPEGLEHYLREDKKISIVADEAIIKLSSERQEDGKVSLTLIHDASKSLNRSAVKYLKRLIHNYEIKIVDEYKSALKIEPYHLAPYIIKEATLDQKGGRFLQSFGIGIGGITIFLLLISSFNPAINTTIGERDENTYKVLLMNPVTLEEIFLGKYLNVAIQGLLSLLPYFIEFIIFAAWGSSLLKFDSLGIFTPQGMGLLALGCVVCSVMLSSICFLVCSFAKTRVQAQSLISLILFMIMIPIALLGITESRLDSFTVWIPLVNFPLTTMALTELPFSYSLIFLGFAVNIVASIALIFFSSGAFKVQWQGQNETHGISDLLSLKRRKATELNSSHAFLAFVLSFIGVSYGIFGLKTLKADVVLYLVAPMVFYFGVGVLILKISSLDFTKVLKWDSLLNKKSLLLPVLAFSLGYTLVAIGPDSFIKVGFPLKANNPSFLSSLGTFFTFALIPAFTGEFFFRGILYNGLRRNYSFAIASTVSTIMFSLTFFALYRSVLGLFIGHLMAYLYEKRGINSCWLFVLFLNFAIIFFQ